MPTRQVDVTIAGKNMASGAFKDAMSGLEGFENRVKRLLNPLHLLKGVLAGLGIASLGAIFRKATEAAIEHERSLGRNVATLDRLKSAWDFVLVRLGQAILGFNNTGSFADKATNALASLGDWIENNKANIGEFAELILKLGDGIANMAKFGGGVWKVLTAGNAGEAMMQAGLMVSGQSSHGTSRTWGGGLDKFQKEQEEAKRRAEFEAEQKAWDAAKHMGGVPTNVRATVGDYAPITGQGIRMPGTDVFGQMKQFEIVPPTLDASIKKIDEMQLAFQQLGESIEDIGKTSIMVFADTWAQATEDIISGAAHLGDAILRAGRKAVGGVLMAKGRETLLDAAKAAVQGFTNPVEFLKAAKLFAIGTAQLAAGQLFAGSGGGGSGGGGGGLGAAGFDQQQRDTERRGTGKVVITAPGVMNMNDPEQAQALADAIKQLIDQRVLDIEVVVP